MEKVGKKIARIFKVRESKSLPQFHGPLTGPKVIALVPGASKTMD